jgi:hypothetical protein
VKQITGDYACRSPRLYSLHWIWRKLASSLQFSCSTTPFNFEITLRTLSTFRPRYPRVSCEDLGHSKHARRNSLSILIPSFRVFEAAWQPTKVLTRLPIHFCDSYAASRCANDHQAFVPRTIALQEFRGRGDIAQRCARRSRGCARNLGTRTYENQHDGRTRDREYLGTYQKR